MSTEVVFGQWLNRRRKELDLTQDELALRVGYSVVLIQKIETGEQRPSKQIAELLAEYFPIPSDESHDSVRFTRNKPHCISSTDGAPRRTLRRQLTNPPIQPTALLRREREIQILKNVLLDDQVHLLTLVASPGIRNSIGDQVDSELVFLCGRRRNVTLSK